MNNRFLFVWGLVMMFLFSSIISIYFKNKDELQYIGIKEDLKKSIKVYFKDNKIKLKYNKSITINSDDLMEGNYIEKIETEDEICSCKIKVTNKIIYIYKFKFNCDSK